MRAKSFSRNTLLEKEDKKTKKDAMIFTSLKGFQRVLKEAHILLTPNLEHRNVFGNTPPMIGWRKARTLKDHLVRAKITSRVILKVCHVVLKHARCVLLLMGKVFLVIVKINIVLISEREF